MGKKGVKSEDGGEKKTKKVEGGEGEKGSEDGVVTAVLKVDMHCEGCAKKVRRSVYGFQGVETVAVDSANHKLTAVGTMDPWELRERVEVKTHKKVVLISPTDPPKKEKEVVKQEKVVEVKPKKPDVSTVVFKIQLHCEGCIQKIRRSIFKVPGVEEVKIDPHKDLVAVKGTMDVKTMLPFLADRLKRKIEIIPAKKDGGEDQKKEKEKDKGKKEVKKESGGDEKKNGDGGKKDDGEAKAEVINRMDHHGVGAAPAAFVPYGYNHSIEMLHAPQYFSDENPNACSVM